MASPAERPFFAESVDAFSGARVKVSKKFLCLTSGELLKVMGRAVKVKDPKISTIRKGNKG